ncbi:serine hydrolase [Massilia sp. 9096]|uniref:serine hydrolase domain-containing protein n=1 Tax=Massilia sp. 9096 TaxID=1500894 RepID=UPI0005636B83|nr:serine hydrolase domain-containing protein [Massilia sp. 9096]
MSSSVSSSVKSVTSTLTPSWIAGRHAVAPPYADIEAEMRRAQVQGLAVAVIDDGQVRSVQTWGWRDAAERQPLLHDTVMAGASLTEAAFAYMVLQLADEGKLNLDTPIDRLLPKPLPAYDKTPYDFASLARDERWRVLTPRILLTHSSGLAKLRGLEPDGRPHFHFTPGDRYAYSGEGIQILQLIIEDGLKLDPEREMQRRVFDRFGMKRTSMRWRDDFAGNAASGYALDGSAQGHGRRLLASAIGSMDTTIEDQARLWAGVVRGDGLSPAARASLVRAWRPIRSARQFPTLAPQDGAHAVTWPQRLAAGLGVVTFRDRSGVAWFKGGHDDGAGNLVLCMESGQRCVVMLANDARAERLYPDIAARVLGPNDMPWSWEYDFVRAPKPAR